MRIAFIITGIQVGGAEMMLYKLIKNRKNLSNSFVLSLTGGGAMEEKFLSLGVPVITLNMKRKFIFSEFTKLIKILKKEKPQLVSTWMYHANLIGGLAAKILKIPVCWNVRASGASLLKTSIGTKIVVKLCAFLSSLIPDRIVYNSEAGASDHVAMGYDKKVTEVIPNGFDLDLFKPDQKSKKAVRTELGLSENDKLVAMVGRYNPIKNSESFIEAAGLVSKKRKEIHFVMVGLGNDQGNDVLTASIKKAQLNGRIHLLGLRKDVAQLMASFDVLVCPSWGEGFPNVIGEAMACGVPCVVTDVGDSAKIVGDYGVVVPSGSVTKLAEGILEIAGLPALKKKVMGQKARNRIKTVYEMNKTGERFEALYQEIIKVKNKKIK